MKRFLREHNFSQKFNSSYHPQTNGANEKVNGTVVKGIKLALQDRPRVKWSTVLKPVTKNYNNTVHDTTGFTPAFLMFGRDKLNTSTPVAEARLLAQRRTDEFKLKKKEAYVKSHQPLNLQIGDLVKRRIPDNRPDVKKLMPKYEGPYRVTALRGPVNVDIAQLEPNSVPFLIHISQLEPYFQRDPQLFDSEE